MKTNKIKKMDFEFQKVQKLYSNYLNEKNKIRQTNILKEYITKLRSFALCNQAEAQFNLGLQYEDIGYYGNAPRKALYWYLKAAKQKHAMACNSVAYCYNTGKGVKKNLTLAIKWYKTAAELSDVGGQYNLALCYQTGEGVKVNIEQAKFWYKKSAEQNHDDSKIALAQILCHENATANHSEVLKLLKSASGKNSFGDAEFYLGELYEYGLGVSKNHKIALSWYLKSHKQGCELATLALARLNFTGKIVKRNYNQAVAYIQGLSNNL